MTNLSTDFEKRFEEAINGFAAAVHEMALSKGFWDASSEAGTKIALIHSELSEALEALRKPEQLRSDKVPGFLEVEEELADAVIRILDFAARNHYDIGGAIIAKYYVNQGRAHMHGKKF